jgi:hypothetical protein
VVRAQGAVHALVVAHDRRVALGVLQPVVQQLALPVHRCVALGVLQPVAQQLALPVHRCVALGVARALRERALVQVLGGLTRRHALVRHRRVR